KVHRPEDFAGLTTPSAALWLLRIFLLMPQPPLLFKEGNVARCQFIHTFKTATTTDFDVLQHPLPRLPRRRVRDLKKCREATLFGSERHERSECKRDSAQPSSSGFNRTAKRTLFCWSLLTPINASPYRARASRPSAPPT